LHIGNQRINPNKRRPEVSERLVSKCHHSDVGIMGHVAEPSITAIWDRYQYYCTKCNQPCGIIWVEESLKQGDKNLEKES
jgi:hypothetical protein